MAPKLLKKIHEIFLTIPKVKPSGKLGNTNLFTLDNPNNKLHLYPQQFILSNINRAHVYFD